MPKKQSGFAHIVLILFLLFGLAAALFTIGDITNLIPKAYQPEGDTFYGEERMYFTENFPQGLFITVCRGNGNTNAGVWQVNSSEQSADYKHDQYEARCEGDLSSSKSLRFTQPLIDQLEHAAYIKLCVPEQNVAWIWQMDGEQSAAILNDKGESFDLCGTPNLDQRGSSRMDDVNFGQANQIGDPAVLSVKSSSSCDKDTGTLTLNWSWDLNVESSQAVAWVYAGEIPIYKNTLNAFPKQKNIGNEVVNVTSGSLSLNSITNTEVFSGGIYELQIKAVNNSVNPGKESAVATDSEETKVVLVAETCTAPTNVMSSLSTNQSSNMPSGCPVSGNITTPFGYNIGGYNVSNAGCGNYKNCHAGVDIGGIPAGADIYSTIDGYVSTKAYDDYKGNYVVITNEETKISTVYEHMQATSPLERGKTYKKGTVVGKAGSTGMSDGVHVHYAVRNGANFINPLGSMNAKGGSLKLNSDDLGSNNYSGSGNNVAYWGSCSR